ncbi:MAG TPA: hypothetical protein VFV34_03850, partial [Blastocatellia bacterium]|nr:hypothetical protein [Blastocatellia bacterium]
MAVIPLCNADALNATLLVNPPTRLIVIVVLTHAPRLTVRFVGFADTEKSGLGFMTRPIDVLLVRPPPVPVIMTVDEPVAAVADAVNVSVVLAPLVEAGLKLAVTPLGNPEALNDTLPVNPPLRVIEMVLVPLAPRLILTLAGLAESAKLGPEPTGGNGPSRNGARKL